MRLTILLPSGWMLYGAAFGPDKIPLLGDEAAGAPVCRKLLRLALLALNIVEVILDGRANHPLVLERLERPLPASWVEQ
jgi:hypothetical protein